MTKAKEERSHSMKKIQQLYTLDEVYSCCYLIYRFSILSLSHTYLLIYDDTIRIKPYSILLEGICPECKRL